MKQIALLITTLTLMIASAFASETVEGVKKDYQTFKQEMSTKLEAMDQKIDQLKAESKENMVKDIEIARDQLRKELNEAKETSSTKWNQFKKSFGQSIDKLNNKVQKALKE